ncbi:MAG: hypothetical protein JWQ71_1483 [Pedosphaera sp.]|nr:hypothetical protein [Pedosphaera sp.]
MDAGSPKRVLFQLVHGVVLGLVSSIFLIFGIAFWRNGGVVLGLSFVGIGSIGILTAFIFGWRGGRLGVELTESDVIIRHYFSEDRIQICAIRSMYRSVDATVLEILDGKVVIDDTYFRDPAACSAFFDALASQIRQAGIRLIAHEASPGLVKLKRRLQYSGLVLQAIGGCIFLFYGIFSIIQGGGWFGFFFVLMGIAFFVAAKFKHKQIG